MTEVRIQSGSSISRTAPGDDLRQRLSKAARCVGMKFDEVVHLAGDVSNRVYVRLGAGSESFIACCYPESFDASEGAATRRKRLCEADPNLLLNQASDPVAFIETTSWLSRHGVPVPRILGIEGELGIMFMEDIGDESLECLEAKETEEEIHGLYQVVVDYTKILQGSTKNASYEGLVACNMILNQIKLFDELLLLRRSLHAYFRADVLAYNERQVLDEWRWLSEQAQPENAVLCHRDYHSRNLFRYRGKVYVLDHQDLRLGHPLYDLASLIWDPYVSLSAERRQKLLEYAGHPPLSDLRPVIIQRLLKALGTYIAILGRYQSQAFEYAAKAAVRDLLDVMHGSHPEFMPLTRRLLRTIHEYLSGKDAEETGGRCGRIRHAVVSTQSEGEANG